MSLKWELGRSGGGYSRATLLDVFWPIRLDAHLLRVPKGAGVYKHTDPIEGMKHYRLNIMLRPAKVGGDFVCSDAFLNLKRVKFFRPDIHEHEVTPVQCGDRLMFSIGWAIKE